MTAGKSGAGGVMAEGKERYAGAPALDALGGRLATTPQDQFSWHCRLQQGQGRWQGGLGTAGQRRQQGLEGNGPQRVEAQHCYSAICATAAAIIEALLGIHDLNICAGRRSCCPTQVIISFCC